MHIKIKRIYEPCDISDGYRVLVDRLWPRGIKKETAKIDLWFKEIAPSTELRKWFDHDAKKWNGFLKKYEAELKTTGAFNDLVALAREHKTLTLLYSAKNEDYNQAVALAQLIKRY